MGAASGAAISGSMGGQLKLGGSTAGYVNSADVVDLPHSTAFLALLIDDSLEAFIQTWRETDDSDHHGLNIGYSGTDGLTGGWVQKVVACADLPAAYLNTFS